MAKTSKPSLAETHPELAAQADGWNPKSVTRGSDKKRSWKCEHGHVWAASTLSRTSGNGCPTCSGRIALTGVNDLATTHPELAAQADGWDPKTVKARSGKKVRWKGECNHIWTAVVANRTKGIGCPICSGHQVLAGYNDLATTNPELAAQADGWDPTTLTAGSGKKVGWRCASGHKWTAQLASRATGIGCPVCSGHQVLAGYNDLATTNPELAAQAAGWDPSTLSAGSNRLVGWICTFGHKWVAPPGRRAQGIGCPVCSNQTIQIGFNDLATTHPELAVQADGWDPRTLSSGANKKRQWKCELGHKWTAVVYSRTAGNSCPSCAKFGFKPSEYAWIYLIENTTLELLQIGITNNPEERIAKHQRSGFEVVLDIRGPLDGYLARDLERACLNTFRKRGAIFAREIDVSIFDGSTESWGKKSLSVTSIKQILDWVYEDEAK